MLSYYPLQTMLSGKTGDFFKDVINYPKLKKRKNLGYLSASRFHS